MKRSLIVAAISTLFLGAAQAEYTIYGLLDGSVGKNIADAQADVAINLHSGGDSGSGQGNSTTRIGLKGSNDIGSGVKANFKLETGGISSDGKVNNDGTFFNRQAWGSLSGSMGEIRFGRQDSVPFQAFIDYDYNGASNGVSAAGYSGAGIWALLPRQSAGLQYFGPNKGAVKVQLGFQRADDVKKDFGVAKAKNVMSGALTYATGPLSLTAAFQTKAGLGANNYFGFAGSYDFGAFKMMAGYHDIKSDKGITLGAQTTLAGVNVGGIYAKKTKDSANSKGSVIELYANKEVFKGTYAYAEMGIADKKVAGGKGTGYAAGLIYTF